MELQGLHIYKSSNKHILRSMRIGCVNYWRIVRIKKKVDWKTASRIIESQKRGITEKEEIRIRENRSIEKIKRVKVKKY